MQPTPLHFLLLPHVHVLDLSGPLQVFYEANGFGANYRLSYCGTSRRVRTAQGMWVSDLEPLPEVGAGDVVVVPGVESTTLGELDHVPVDWLRRSHASGARIVSICSGAFVLGHAGLLDGRRCTTHWKVADRLQRDYPAARVARNRLFIADGNVVTSAGVASGIDTALWLVEQDHGPMVVAKVAREIVVYLRRDGRNEQKSIYLEYRTHLHPGIHRVQDWLVAHPDRKPTLDALAEIAAMSPRNLTRVFRQATGITLKSFATRLKLEVAGNLIRGSDLTLESIAAECGFKDSRQLRRLWQRSFGASPSEWKQQEHARAAPTN